MTIAAELLRLTAIESLAPFAAVSAGEGFPTLAKGRVYDSRRPPIDDMDRDQDYTPVLSLFTRKSESARRGTGQGNVSRNGRAILEIVAELAIAATDPEPVPGQPGEFVDALASDDPQAKITLAVLCAQVRHALTEGQSGAIFRKACIAVDGLEEEGFAVPELGLRWHRTTMVLDCQIPDDAFQASGGLPQPAASIAAMLPPGSYASIILDRLAGQFLAAEPLPRIETIAFETKQHGVSGQAGTAAHVGPPFADVEE
jgi:hypothetical protein